MTAIDLVNEKITCPLLAITQLNGNALKVYLLLRFYALNGGDIPVTPTLLSDTLRINRSTVVLVLIELCLSRWLICELTNPVDFMKDKLVLETNWIVSEPDNSEEQLNNNFTNLISNIIRLNPSELINDDEFFGYNTRYAEELIDQAKRI